MNDTSNTPSPVPAARPALQLSLSWRTVSILLLLVIAVIVYLWKPWVSPTAARTITVEGSATVSAVPDTYDFNPVFENADVKAATAAGNDAVAALKKLGVADADIKTTISSPPSVKPLPAEPNVPTMQSYPIRSTATYAITATVHDKALAQKVSDYLATTKATGLVTPTASFSKDTKAKLDLSARTKASADAKAKATATAEQLGAHVGKVVKISEATWPGIYAPGAATDAASPLTLKADGGPTVQPGTNEVSYSFTVEFELK